MADVTTQTKETQTTEVSGQQIEGKQPTVEELMAQLATERAEKEKYKNRSDKASSEAAEYKKQLRSKQTAEEQEAEAKAEAQRIADEERESMRKELNHIKAVAAYNGVSEKSVEKLIDAVSESDHTAIATIIENEKKSAVAEAQAEWMRTRPRVNIGGGEYSGMTKDQIMAIPDRNERRRAIAMNQDLF